MPTADGRSPVRGGTALAAAVLAGLALAGVHLAVRHARPALVNLGPNDLEYTSGFREGWERDADGLTRFHWTLRSSIVRLPVRAEGAGHRLRVRLGRHFIEPSEVTLTVEGRAVARFAARAHDRERYQVVDVPLPAMAGRAPFAVLIESRSALPSTLGIAVDWVELVGGSPSAVFRLSWPGATRLPVATVVVLALVLAAGGPRRAALSAAVVVLASGLAGFWADVVATERILRLGLPTFAVVGALAVLLVRWRVCASWLRVEAPVAAAALTTTVLVALGIRLVLLLHPQFYYPDVRIHAQFAHALGRRGLAEFLRRFIEDQFRYSLGLQLENGHWYAFPYPPAFYVACWPLVRLARYAPEVAVSLVPAALNSLEALAIYALGRRLGLSCRASLSGAAALPLLPIFLARLTLAYFPAMTGHLVDTLVLLYLVTHLRDIQRPRVFLTLGLLLGASFLTYTQSLLNFALLIPLFLALQLRDRSAGALRRWLAWVAAGVVGVVLSLAFYGRYVPIFLDMRRGVPMPEEQVLLDKLQHAPPAVRDAPPQAQDDPYAGPGVDPIRGLTKAAWRLYVFYGYFAPALIAGLLLVLRRLGGLEARFVVAWGTTYVLLNLASGGLPGPNLVRYNKDLEVIAPLCCLALGVLGVTLFERGRALGLGFVFAWTAFSGSRAVRYLTEKFVLER